MIRSITLRSFRNLADQEWMPAPATNLVYGPNGAGKSSLLEATYLAATTRSFRTPWLAECCRIGASEFFVGADTEGGERTRLEVAWGPEGKRRAVNARTGTIVEHLAVVPVVSWTTRDNEIFQGPPAVRRHLIDRGVVSAHPASMGAVSEYRQALEAKRAALASPRGSLEEWNRILARTGAGLVGRRSAWIARLAAALSRVLEESGFGLGPVELRYRPSPAEAVAGEEALLASIEKLARLETARRQVLAGPHRDDLEILWRNGPVGRMASAGERKLLGLAMMVAHAELLEERGGAPLVLIDDLDAELDRERVGQVWDLLGQGRQLIAATSRKSVVNRLAASARWSLGDGFVLAT
jgi:DNA replication and repair protein RecF